MKLARSRGLFLKQRDRNRDLKFADGVNTEIGICLLNVCPELEDCGQWDRMANQSLSFVGRAGVEWELENGYRLQLCTCMRHVWLNETDRRSEDD